jgi:hypothetical protein
VFNAAARATDGSGIRVDIPRTWLLVREIITAPEAPVQWVFMYEPIARQLIEHAQRIGEPEAVIARARRTVRQPGDSARHDDHMHVRLYCSTADRAYGCVDLGPMEMLAERQAEPSPSAALLDALASASSAPAPGPEPASPPGDQAGTASLAPSAAALAARPRLGRMLRTHTDRITFPRWR